MANKKISALSSATTPLAGTETLPVVQGGATTQVSVANLTAGRTVSAASLITTGAITSGTVLTSGSYFVVQSSGVARAYVGSAGDIVAGGAVADMALSTPAVNNMIFAIANYEKFRIDVNGNFVPKGTGNGINFTANTPAAGMTSQLLNWYEEGTWTPNKGQCTVVGTFSSSGTYTRVGRVVTLRLNLSGSTSITCATGAQVTTNLPYASSTDTPALYINGGFSVSGAVDTSGTIMYAVGTIATTNSIIITATYQV